ncbi:MAG: threonine--tRNA ligase [Candidatus Aenigmatarchaeota archaeon]
MKILLIHSDYLEFEPKQKAIKSAEEAAGKKKIEDCLVVFIAAEKSDEKNVKEACEKLVAEISDVATQVKAEKIVLYPYAHLSKDLASPEIALKIMKESEAMLSGFSVTRAPFGWYKAFTIKCKGHPLSELSREIIIGDEKKDKEIVSKAVDEEEKVKSTWHILTPNGELHDIEMKNGKLAGFDFSKHKNLEKFASYEIKKVRVYGKEPPHIKLMKKLEIADYEEGSDPGNLRFYPKGRLIKSLLETWVTKKVIDYGAMEIESPVMYDFEHPALKSYLDRFPARQYVVESAKKKFFLRFSACFGQFLMKSGMNISYKDLPLRMYELTKSFRLEKAGELVGLKRLRAFTMPDMHTLCKDLAAARNEFRNQFELCMSCMDDLEIGDYETAIRFTKDFWKDNKDFVASLVKIVKKPVLIEIWNFRYAYFDPKFEFNIIDASDKASALSTVQIDHENAERYGIQFTDSDNKRKYPTILHASPSGGIERVMYALLEKAYIENPKSPTLPFWLSPTQIRLCPVNDSFIKDAEKIADKFDFARVDIDDRTEGIARKVAEAESEWVPMIIVFGEKEKSGDLPVRFHETGKTEKMKLEELMKLVKEKMKKYPYKPLSLPRLLSKRPTFVG